MPHGGPRPNSGRKPGIAKRLLDSCAREVKLTGCTPAEFLDKMMHNPDVPPNVQADAAKALMPYVHKKQPEAHEVDHTGLPESIHFTFG